MPDSIRRPRSHRGRLPRPRSEVYPPWAGLRLTTTAGAGGRVEATSNENPARRGGRPGPAHDGGAGAGGIPAERLNQLGRERAVPIGPPAGGATLISAQVEIGRSAYGPRRSAGGPQRPQEYFVKRRGREREPGRKPGSSQREEHPQRGRATGKMCSCDGAGGVIGRRSTHHRAGRARLQKFFQGRARVYWHTKGRPPALPHAAEV